MSKLLVGLFYLVQETTMIIGQRTFSPFISGIWYTREK